MNVFLAKPSFSEYRNDFFLSCISEDIISPLPPCLPACCYYCHNTSEFFIYSSNSLHSLKFQPDFQSLLCLFTYCFINISKEYFFLKHLVKTSFYILRNELADKFYFDLTKDALALKLETTAVPFNLTCNSGP